jgi:hypothetical protein
MGSRAPWLATLVVFVALWPLAQHALMAHYGGDAWRLGGFAMYADYQSTQVALFDVEPGGLRLVDETSLPREARDAVARFRRLRGAVGSLASPDAAVRAVYAARPDLENLVVVVQRLWLDPETALVDSEKEILPYVAGEPLGELEGDVPAGFVPPET